jgi:RNA polymerase sigma-70 factor, ECF subfamily
MMETTIPSLTGMPRIAAFECEAVGIECAELIGRIAEGDQEALTRLYDLTNRRVFGLTLRILTDPTAAEEVVLDVYLQVWQQAERYDPSRGRPLAWLFTIARSRAIDALRKTRQTSRRTEPIERADGRVATGIQPDDSAADSELRSTVLAALDTLPPQQRTVLELAYFSGMSHSEIAEELGLPLGTVKTRTRLALIRLRGSLDGMRDYF